MADGAEKPFQCATCDECFSTIPDLAKHEKSHLSPQPVNPYQCGACNKTFAKSDHLLIHKWNHCGGNVTKPLSLPQGTSVVKVEMPETAPVDEEKSGSDQKFPEVLVNAENPVKSGGEDDHSISDPIEVPVPLEFLQRHREDGDSKIPTGKEMIVESKLDTAKPTNANATAKTIGSDTHQEEDQDEDLPYQCATCDECFATIPDLAVHERFHLPPKPVKRNPFKPKKKYQPSHSMEDERYYPAPSIDPRQFLQVSWKDGDSKNPTEDERLVQDGSKLETAKPTMLPNVKHFLQDLQDPDVELTQNEENQFQCATCDEGFTTIPDLAAHEASHLASEPVQQNPFKQKKNIKKGKKSEKTKKIHTCRFCPKTFEFKCGVVKHERKHTGERPYSCKFCGQKFKETSNLYAHERKCGEGGKPFECPMCDKTFTFKQSLMDHEKTHTQEELAASGRVRPPSPKPSVFECNSCFKTFKYEKAWSQHKAKCDRKGVKEPVDVKPEESPDTKTEKSRTGENPSKTWHCKLCSKGFKYRKACKRHQAKCDGRKHSVMVKFKGKHSNEDSADDLIIEVEVDPGEAVDLKVPNNMEDSLEDKPFGCTFCDKSYGTFEALNEHINNHDHCEDDLPTHNMRIKTETEDDSMIEEREDWNNHVFVCETCSEGFNTPEQLQEHEMIHTGEKPFQCANCEQCFTNLQDLVHHEASHLSPPSAKRNPFKPKIQFKEPKIEFMAPKTKTKTRKRGDGKQVHVCRFCNKEYACRSMVERHERKHTGERPYSCKFCGQKFKETSNMYAHERKCGGGGKPFHCEECGKSFTYKQSLKIHEETHNREDSNYNSNYECRFCAKGFKKMGKALSSHEAKCSQNQASEDGD